MRMSKTAIYCFLVFFLLVYQTKSQTSTSDSLKKSSLGKITISGKVYNAEDRNLPLPKLMVINSATNQGSFADAEGKFTIQAKQTDTIVLSSTGFMVKKICLKDSSTKNTYFIEIPLFKMHYVLREVTVFETRSLSQIQKDIDRLGVKSTYKTEGVADAMSSPITYLYERFSRLEKSKRKVAEWENEDLKREVLKDLFKIYIKNDIIDLSSEEFDAFIVYLNLSDDFIINASQYELVMAIKGKYESFKYRWK